MSARRLFAANGPGLVEHRGQFGELPQLSGQTLIAALDQSGLTGRGGAGFPTGRKIASVTGRKPVAIGNGAEGEPLSHKDTVLLSRAPHLVLDGLNAAAAAVGADTVFLYLPSHLLVSVRGALNERAAARTDRYPATIIEAPDTFVAGEESAVIRRIEGGPALPRDRTVLSTKSGAWGRPTLVNNVETLAHIALIARYGPAWFRSLGDPAEPGTMLVTLSGALDQPAVVEVPTGALLRDVIARLGGTDPDTLRAVLLGGYHGRWLPPEALAGVGLSRSDLARFNASPGAGIVHPLGRHECGLARTADIAAYLADQSAGQCGPCRNGLPRLTQLLHEVAYGHVDDVLIAEVHRLLGLVDGRGSCRHPDGTAGLVRSALTVFGSDIAAHRYGRCEAELIPAERCEALER